jgi:predicted transcriptional regulator
MPSMARQPDSIANHKTMRKFPRSSLNTADSELLHSESDSNHQLERFQSELQTEIIKMYSFIKSHIEDMDMIKEEVIVLDYLVTLRQLITLLQNNGLEGFHTKSKMEAIVDGAPSKNITKEHVRAISAKLRAIKLL